MGIEGIRDLKRDLQQAMSGLAEVKGVAICLSKGAEDASRHLEVDFDRRETL